MKRIGVLASGSGSTFQAIVEGLASSASAQVATLICNVPGARVIERAAKAGIATTVIDHREFKGDRAAFDARVVEALRTAQVEWVCLAGYMRLVTPAFLNAFKDRVINVHPALLPSFPGMHAVRQAIDAGVRIAGCTIHFVDEGTDTGPIIAQASVAVAPSDTEESLAQRIHLEEHRLYPRVIEALATGRVQLSGRRVHLEAPL